MMRLWFFLGLSAFLYNLLGLLQNYWNNSHTEVIDLYLPLALQVLVHIEHHVLNEEEGFLQNPDRGNSSENTNETMPMEDTTYADYDDPPWVNETTTQLPEEPPTWTSENETMSWNFDEEGEEGKINLYKDLIKTVKIALAFEAVELELDTYKSLSDDKMNEMVAFSEQFSVQQQIEFLLKEVLNKKEVVSRRVVGLTTIFLKEMSLQNSTLVEMLENVPPLKYTD